MNTSQIIAGILFILTSLLQTYISFYYYKFIYAHPYGVLTMTLSWCLGAIAFWILYTKKLHNKKAITIPVYGTIVLSFILLIWNYNITTDREINNYGKRVYGRVVKIDRGRGSHLKCEFKDNNKTYYATYSTEGKEVYMYDIGEWVIVKYSTRFPHINEVEQVLPEKNK